MLADYVTICKECLLKQNYVDVVFSVLSMKDMLLVGWLSLVFVFVIFRYNGQTLNYEEYISQFKSDEHTYLDFHNRNLYRLCGWDKFDSIHSILPHEGEEACKAW